MVKNINATAFNQAYTSLGKVFFLKNYLMS